jgi:hypothetical protein
LWNRAEQQKERVVLLAYLVQLQYKQIVIASQFADQYGIDIGKDKMAKLEPEMLSLYSEIEQLRKLHCDVNGYSLGVRLSSSGNDLDIVESNPSLGAIWIPIAIGAVVLVGIIARWAVLEQREQKLSNLYNGILHHANNALCADPNSDMCKAWTAKKQSGAYAENETVMDSVKNAVSKVGGAVSKGLGVAVMIGIPLLMLMYLPKRRG